LFIPMLPPNESSSHFEANAFTSSRIEPISRSTFGFPAALGGMTVLSR
jgi:hypothetical protein